MHVTQTGTVTNRRLNFLTALPFVLTSLADRRWINVLAYDICMIIKQELEQKEDICCLPPLCLPQYHHVCPIKLLRMPSEFRCFMLLLYNIGLIQPICLNLSHAV